MRHHHIKALASLASLAAALLLTGCTSEELTAEGTAQSSPQPMTFALTVPDAINPTRAAADRNSALGGITNADWDTYKLRCLFAAYENTAAAGATENWQPASLNAAGDKRLTKWFENATEAAAKKEFVAYLHPDKQYKIVCWADFVLKSAPATDVHYATTDLTAITCQDAVTAQLNDESRDAYYVEQDYTMGGSDPTTLVLRRPFAKLRVVTTDWGQSDELKPDKFSIIYKNCKRFTGLNALTGEAAGGTTALAATETTAYTANLLSDDNNGAKYYGQSYDSSEKNRTIIVDYLFAKPEQTVIAFQFTALKSDGTVITTKDIGPTRDSDQPNPDYSATNQQATAINTDIPICRNYLTTILGNLCQKPETQLRVAINEWMSGEYVDGEPWWDPKELTPAEPSVADGVYQIYTADELAWLANKTAAIDKGVKLMADIDMNNISWWKPIKLANSGQTALVWDGNNKTIRNFYATPIASGSDYQSAIFSELSGWEFKDTKFENVTLQGLHEHQSGTVSPLRVGIFAKASGEGTTISGITADHVFIFTPEAAQSATPVTEAMAAFLVAEATKVSVSNSTLSDCNLYIPATLGLDATSNKLSVGAVFGKKANDTDCTWAGGTLTECYIHKPQGYSTATFPGLTIDTSNGVSVVDFDGK